jgi:diadenosine tetraphosphate (Ap4A) HIT family hydrolase
MSFSLDPRLTADTLAVGDLALCCVRLMNDRRYPWLVLVPRIEGAVEVHALAPAERALLLEETTAAARALAELAPGHKINIGALGNVVRQLHVHVLARHEGDPAWPGPVWGHSPAVAYEPAAAKERIGCLRALVPALNV